MYKTTAYVGNGAVGFGEREWGRTLRKSPVDFFSDEPESVPDNFFGGIAKAFEREKNWSWSFVLIFCFFLIKQKENEKYLK